LITYCGIAAAIGGGFITLISADLPALRAALCRYCVIGLSLGLLATAAGFFIQVALFAEQGISGLWHWPTAEILWNTTLGSSVQLRLGGLLVGLVFCWPRQPRGNRLLALAYGLMVLLLSASFTAVGHTLELSPLIRLLLAVHLLFVAGWIGSLWPLLRACGRLPGDELLVLMQRFSRWAIICVPLLGLAGGVMAYQLSGSIEALVGTGYGQLLLVKVVFFMLLLVLASLNKYRWLPALSSDADAVEPLARSIRWELCLALLVFAVTAALSGVLGPGLM